MSLDAIRNVGKYQPLALLGQGGMANVYLATATGPGNFAKLIVLKELRSELASDPEFRAMFLDEARLAARLSHPNIVQTFEVVEDAAGAHVIVMEYLDGQPMNRLRSRLQERGAAGVAAQIRILLDLLAGLQYAHELADFDGTPLKIVHRDVSPHNVFITYGGEVKLVDFGIAKAVDSASRTQTGEIKGKLSYMAPEQAMGSGVDRRADLFAVGIMLWEVLSGKRMWRGLQEVGIMHALAVGEIPKLSTVMPEASELACRIVDRALSKRPQDRYATAEEFRRELEAFAKLGDHQPTSREVGQMLFETFGEERKQIQAVIEERMRAVKLGQNGDGRPSLAPLPTVIPRDVPSFSSPLNVAGTSGPSQFRSVITVPPPEPRERARNMRVAAIALALTALAATALAVTILLARGPAGAPPSAGTSAPTPTVSASAAPARGAMLTVDAEPSKAHVFVDDMLLPANPGAIRVQADGSIHRIRVEAPGFVTQTQEVTMEGDRTFKITLSSLTGPVRVTGTGAATAVGPGTGVGHVKPPASGDPDLGF